MAMQIFSVVLALLQSHLSPMKPLPPATVKQILFELDQGKSYRQIQLSTGASLGVISFIRAGHRSTLPRAPGGCPQKLSAANIHYAICSVTSSKPATAASVTRDLMHITHTLLNLLLCAESRKLLV